MPSPKVTASFTNDGQSLHVEYTVANEGPGDIFLLNVLWRLVEGGGIIPDPRSAYISLGAEGNLRVGKIVHPVPTQKFVEQAIVPFAQRMAGRAVFRERFDIPVPVREYNPYYPEDENTKWRQIEIRSVELWVSWLPNVDGLKVTASPQGVGVRLEHPQLMRLCQTAISPSVMLSVPGERRTDLFERF